MGELRDGRSLSKYKIGAKANQNPLIGLLKPSEPEERHLVQNSINGDKQKRNTVGYLGLEFSGKVKLVPKKRQHLSLRSNTYLFKSPEL